MSLTTTFDDLVTSVAQIQRKADVIMERLHEINSDVRAAIYSDGSVVVVRSGCRRRL